MASDKTHGPDDLTAGFYLNCLKIIGQDFMAAINQMQNSGNIPLRNENRYHETHS